MPHYIMIPFAIFFACCVAQFWFVKQVRNTLIERHPATFLAIEKAAIFPGGGIWRFISGRKYRELDDPLLNRRVANLKRLYAVGVAAWIAMAISMFALPKG